MEYAAPNVLTSYLVPELSRDARGFASDPVFCDRDERADSGHYPDCTYTFVPRGGYD